jgi:hypothetical protein
METNQEFTILRKGPPRMIPTRTYTGSMQPTSAIEGLPEWLEVRCGKCGATFRAPQVRRATAGTYRGC